jgi:hypothetical protein
MNPALTTRFKKVLSIEFGVYRYTNFVFCDPSTDQSALSLISSKINVISPGLQKEITSKDITDSRRLGEVGRHPQTKPNK